MAEARAECERWLAYLEREENRSLALQELAADRRAGRCDDEEKDKRMREINGVGLTVYDGGNLEKAVRCLLANVPKTT